MLMLTLTAPELKITDGHSVSSIIQEDISMLNGKRTIVMIGRSGCGKTATIVCVARAHYLVYICCNTGERLADLHDPSYLQMTNDIKRQDSIGGTIQWKDSETLLKHDTVMK